MTTLASPCTEISSPEIDCSDMPPVGRTGALVCLTMLELRMVLVAPVSTSKSQETPFTVPCKTSDVSSAAPYTKTHSCDGGVFFLARLSPFSPTAARFLVAVEAEVALGFLVLPLLDTLCAGREDKDKREPHDQVLHISSSRFLAP